MKKPSKGKNIIYQIIGLIYVYSVIVLTAVLIYHSSLFKTLILVIFLMTINVIILRKLHFL